MFTRFFRQVDACTKFQRRKTTTAENGKKIISSGSNIPLSLSKTSSLIPANIESKKAFSGNWNSCYYNVSPEQSQRHSAQHSLWNRKRQQRWRIACLLGQQWRFQRRIGTIDQNGCSGHQGMEEGLRLHKGILLRIGIYHLSGVLWIQIIELLEWYVKNCVCRRVFFRGIQNLSMQYLTFLASLSFV